MSGLRYDPTFTMYYSEDGPTGIPLPADKFVFNLNEIEVYEEYNVKPPI
jgi:hypothetical protein